MPDRPTPDLAAALIGELERTHREHAEERQQLAAAIRALLDLAREYPPWQDLTDVELLDGPDMAPHRPLLLAVLGEPEPEPVADPLPRCGDMGSGPDWRGFVFCTEPRGLHPEHSNGEWRWATGAMPHKVTPEANP